MIANLFRVGLASVAAVIVTQPSFAALQARHYLERRPPHRFVESRRPAANRPFDGRWSVEVVTLKGDCDRAYRWRVGIKDNHIVDAGDQVAQASGFVDRHGHVRARFTLGADVLTATGALSGKWGVGLWNAPTRACSGRWRAEKRK